MWNQVGGRGRLGGGGGGGGGKGQRPGPFWSTVGRSEGTHQSTSATTTRRVDRSPRRRAPATTRQPLQWFAGVVRLAIISRGESWQLPPPTDLLTGHWHPPVAALSAASEIRLNRTPVRHAAPQKPRAPAAVGRAQSIDRRRRRSRAAVRLGAVSVPVSIRRVCSTDPLQRLPLAIAKQRNRRPCHATRRSGSAFLYSPCVPVLLPVCRSISVCQCVVATSRRTRPCVCSSFVERFYKNNTTSRRD